MKGSIKKEIKTNNYSKSGSYSKPSTTTKAKASSKSNSSTKNSSSTSKSTVNSSQKRDTFTNSSAKVQKTSKTTQNAKTSCSKSSNSSKTTVKSTSTVNNSSKTAVSSKSSAQSKSNRDTFTYSSQTTATKSKTTLTASKTSSKTNAKNQTASGSSNRDTFSCSAKMKNLTRITKTSAGTTQKSNSVKNNKTSVSSKSNAAKTNTQAKSTPTKNNDTVTNKSVTASSKSKILESIQKQYEHTTDSKQKEAMKKTIGDIASGSKSQKAIKTTDILVDYDRSKIKSQFEYYTGIKACYATSADNMWRVNDGAVGNKIIQLANDHKNDGIITDAPHDENYTYTSDSGKVFTNNGKVKVSEYYGKDDNGKNYTATRLQGLQKDDYTDLVLQELNKNKIVCVRVVKEVGQDPQKGHTMNVVGVNNNGEFLYEDCGRYTSTLSHLKPVTLINTGYTNREGIKREYFEVQEGQYEIWIDTTK